MRRLCVFCGSSPGRTPTYKTAAQVLGQAMVQRGIGLVYGGAKVGIMGAIADTVLDLGGEAIGVIPKALMKKELAHEGLNDLKVVSSMHERKALMADLSDGFVALPGGFGTLEELFEALTWLQLGFHKKPCGLLDVNNYFEHLRHCVEHMVNEGFAKAVHGDTLLYSEDPNVLIQAMLNFQPPRVGKWLEEDIR